MSNSIVEIDSVTHYTTGYWYSVVEQRTEYKSISTQIYSKIKKELKASGFTGFFLDISMRDKNLNLDKKSYCTITLSIKTINFYKEEIDEIFSKILFDNKVFLFTKEK